MILKRGTVFEHANWIDPDKPAADRIPLTCIVTAIRYGQVYYAAAVPDGDGWKAAGKAGHYFPLADAAKRVRRVL